MIAVYTNIVSSAVLNNQFFKALETGNRENGIKGFESYLSDAITKTNDMIIQADNINHQFAAGNIDDIHKVLIAVEKADIALQFTLQVRNKIIDAYNEIMRMQI